MKIKTLDKKSAPEEFNDIIKNGPTLALFYTPFCGWCKKILPVWEQLEEIVIKDDNDANLLKVNLVGVKTVSKEIRSYIRGVPSVMIINSKGAVVEVYKGNRSLETFEAFLKTSLLKTPDKIPKMGPPPPRRPARGRRPPQKKEPEKKAEKKVEMKAEKKVEMKAEKKVEKKEVEKKVVEKKEPEKKVEKKKVEKKVGWKRRRWWKRRSPKRKPEKKVVSLKRRWKRRWWKEEVVEKKESENIAQPTVTEDRMPILRTSRNKGNKKGK